MFSRILTFFLLLTFTTFLLAACGAGPGYRGYAPMHGGGYGSMHGPGHGPGYGGAYSAPGNRGYGWHGDSAGWGPNHYNGW